MTILDHFEHGFVINLPSRRDRREAIIHELEKAGMTLSSGKVSIFPAIRPESPGAFPSIGARGCFLSHLQVLKTALKLDLKSVLLMEDDLVISPVVSRESEGLIRDLVKYRWDFVYLGHTVEQVEAPGIHLLPFKRDLRLTHFYAIQQAVIEPLISFFEGLLERPQGHPEGGPMHLDLAYNLFRSRTPGVRTLIASPNLGWQRKSRSDIYPNRWFDRLPGFKGAAARIGQPEEECEG